MDDQEYDEYTGAENEPVEDEDETGAYSWPKLLDEDSREVPEAFQNPAGASRGDCDDEEAAGSDPSCDIEATALTEDQVLEESMPGIGIDGFEGEEVGGG